MKPLPTSAADSRCSMAWLADAPPAGSVERECAVQACELIEAVEHVKRSLVTTGLSRAAPDVSARVGRNADARRGYLRCAKASLEAGDTWSARLALQSTRKIIAGDVARLSRLARFGGGRGVDEMLRLEEDLGRQVDRLLMRL